MRAIFGYVKEAKKDQGSWLLYNTLSHLFYFLYYKKFRPGSKHHTFIFRENTYHYFYSFYHATYMNERAVEIPIIMKIVDENMNKRILEVGNVLPHYFDFRHTVVDKYEVSDGVINEDIVNFKSDVQYDLVISISTLEHVGWDERPRDDTKILSAIANLKTLLSKNGFMVISLPIGQNPVLDSMIKENIITFDEQYFLIRISKSNRWKEASWNEVKDIQYNEPYPNANAVIIGTMYGSHIGLPVPKK